MRVLGGLLKFVGIGVLVLVVVAAVGLYAARPVQRLNMTVTTSPAPQPAAIVMDLITGSPSVGDELTELIRHQIVAAEQNPDWPSALHVTGFQLALNGDHMEARAAVTLFNRVSLGPVVRLSPTISGNRLGVRVEAVRIGRIPFPRRFLLSRLVALQPTDGNSQPGSFALTVEGDTLWVDGLLAQLPPAISISDLRIVDGTFEAKLSLNPNMVTDALSLLKQVDLVQLDQRITPGSRPTYRELADAVLNLDPQHVTEETALGLWTLYQQLDRESQLAIQEQIIQDVGQEQLDQFSAKYVQPE